MDGLEARQLTTAGPWHSAQPASASRHQPHVDRLGVAAMLVGVFAVLASIHIAVWQLAPWSQLELLGTLSALLPYAWLLAVPNSVLGVIGLFVVPPRSVVATAPLDPDVEISFRIVTRGTNHDALRATVESIRAQMQIRPRFRYRIEVVTDRRVPLDPAADLIVMRVPQAYRTAAGALFKARALQYAMEHSSLSDADWIMHLDEESHLTGSAIDGIATAVAEEEASGQHRIGQGAILYHRDIDRNRLLTLADMIRTGDDFGRYRLQHRLGQTLFGLHGSFILVRNSVEQEVGFDFGPLGSITEDAYWALIQMERGRRSRWVDGFISEQPPHSVMDFLRQRRRWFVGLTLIALGAPISWRHRVVLAASVGTWSLSWMGVSLTYANLALGIAAPLGVALLADLALAYHVTIYLLGLQINLRQSGRAGVRTLPTYLQQAMLIPIFAALEAGSVVYGILRPDTGFHVVDK